MKNLVLVISGWWSKVAALWPKGKTREYIEYLQSEVENHHAQACLLVQSVQYWRSMYANYAAENNELKKQLAEKISELQKTDSWTVELNNDKTQLIAESNKLNDQCLRLTAQVQRLTASVQDLERDREVWVEKTQAHRDARRIICAELNKLGQIDSYTPAKPPLNAPPPNEISYRTPTVEDLKNGPIAVEVSIGGSKWEPRTLQRITRAGRFVCESEDSLDTNSFRFARIPYTPAEPPPQATPPKGISYRTPTVEDLKNGPIWVEVSENRVDWSPYYLIEIAPNGSFRCQYIRGVSSPTNSFRFARIPEQRNADAENKTV